MIKVFITYINNNNEPSQIDFASYHEHYESDIIVQAFIKNCVTLLKYKEIHHLSCYVKVDGIWSKYSSYNKEEIEKLLETYSNFMVEMD